MQVFFILLLCVALHIPPAWLVIILFALIYIHVMRPISNYGDDDDKEV